MLPVVWLGGTLVEKRNQRLLWSKNEPLTSSPIGGRGIGLLFAVLRTHTSCGHAFVGMIFAWPVIRITYFTVVSRQMNPVQRNSIR
jgi:hypothetical protein